MKTTEAKKQGEYSMKEREKQRKRNKQRKTTKKE